MCHITVGRSPYSTLSRKDGGPDGSFSMEPQEFKAMTDAVRIAEAAIGQVNYQITESEQASRVFRRSLFVVKDMVQGEAFTSENVRCIRPGDGLHPRHLQTVIGQYAVCDIKKGTPLAWDIVMKQPHAIS